VVLGGGWAQVDGSSLEQVPDTGRWRMMVDRDAKYEAKVSSDSTLLAGLGLLLTEASWRKEVMRNLEPF
jgi:hypothetical protein